MRDDRAERREEVITMSFVLALQGLELPEDEAALRAASSLSLDCHVTAQ